jgi:antibiotic biosynthesis monooxygenase (ABM) superfamily enzyme
MVGRDRVVAHVSPGLNSGNQAWCQIPLPREPPQWPLLVTVQMGLFHVALTLEGHLTGRCPSASMNLVSDQHHDPEDV